MYKKNNGQPYCQQIAACQRCNLSSIAERSTHHHRLVPEFLVVAVDLSYALDTCHIIRHSSCVLTQAANHQIIKRLQAIDQ